MEREEREIIFEDKTLGNYMLMEGKMKNISELREKVGLSIENDGSVVMFLKGGSSEY